MNERALTGLIDGRWRTVNGAVALAGRRCVIVARGGGRRRRSVRRGARRPGRGRGERERGAQLLLLGQETARHPSALWSRRSNNWHCGLVARRRSQTAARGSHPTRRASDESDEQNGREESGRASVRGKRASGDSRKRKQREEKRAGVLVTLSPSETCRLP